MWELYECSTKTQNTIHFCVSSKRFLKQNLLALIQYVIKHSLVAQIRRNIFVILWRWQCTTINLMKSIDGLFRILYLALPRAFSVYFGSFSLIYGIREKFNICRVSKKTFTNLTHVILPNIFFRIPLISSAVLFCKGEDTETEGGSL